MSLFTICSQFFPEGAQTQSVPLICFLLPLNLSGRICEVEPSFSLNTFPHTQCPFSLFSSSQRVIKSCIKLSCIANVQETLSQSGLKVSPMIECLKRSKISKILKTPCQCGSMDKSKEQQIIRAEDDWIPVAEAPRRRDYS